MKPPSPIVAAVDFSSPTAEVLAHAARIATAMAAPLVVVHIIDRNRVRDWQADVEAPLEDLARDLHARLAKLVSEFCPGVAAELVVRFGRPDRGLCDIVSSHAAVMLVLGAHDTSRRRLGHVASHCCRHLAAPLLILRDWQGSAFRQLAVCIDLEPASTAELEWAVRVAEIYQTSVEVIHVLEPAYYEPMSNVLEPTMAIPVNDEGRVRERAEARMAALVAPVTERLEACSSRVSVVFLAGEAPAKAIATHLAGRAIDLVVLGAQPGSWLAEFIRQRHTRRLLHDSDASILIVR